MGTLGRQGNSKVVDYIRNRLDYYQRENVTILLSEIYPNKLDLFKGIDAFIQIACPRLSIDWGNSFKRPLLNPYEIAVALGDLKFTLGTAVSRQTRVFCHRVQFPFGEEAVLHRFSNPHHERALFKQSQYEVWVPSYTTGDISKDESTRKSLTKKTFIVRTTINFLATKEENVFRKRNRLYQSISISHILLNQMQWDILTTGNDGSIVRCKISIQGARNDQYFRRVPGIHQNDGNLGFGGLGCSFNKNGYTYRLLPNADLVLVEIGAAREIQPTPNLDPMVCKFLRNQLMLNITPLPGGRFRVNSKVITMRREHTTLKGGKIYPKFKASTVKTRCYNVCRCRPLIILRLLIFSSVGTV
ncbi:hypothetical protein Trydic_g12880 [Trypoxylus dichotomus]